MNEHTIASYLKTDYELDLFKSVIGKRDIDVYKLYNNVRISIFCVDILWGFKKKFDKTPMDWNDDNGISSWYRHRVHVVMVLWYSACGNMDHIVHYVKTSLPKNIWPLFLQWHDNVVYTVVFPMYICMVPL